MNTRPDTPLVDWTEVRTVLLDMDGTLLDLHFDNTFWREHVPLRYAQRHGIDLEEARAHLLDRYRAVEGTMQWYSVDYWTDELGLDIVALKRELEHLIGMQPHAVEFLEHVRDSGRRLVLVTNAHAQSLALKLARTDIGPHFDLIVCAHDLGLPKESTAFWDLLSKREPFDPATTLLVDDNLSVLRAARTWGLRRLLAVHRPDSHAPRRDVGGFPAIESFRDIMPPR